MPFGSSVEWNEGCEGDYLDFVKEYDPCSAVCKLHIIPLHIKRLTALCFRIVLKIMHNFLCTRNQKEPK